MAHRPRARHQRGHGQVPREEHPPQAAGDEPRGRGRASTCGGRREPTLDEVRARIAELVERGSSRRAEGEAVLAAQAAHERRSPASSSAHAAVDRVLRAVASLRGDHRPGRACSTPRPRRSCAARGSTGSILSVVARRASCGRGGPRPRRPRGRPSACSPRCRRHPVAPRAPARRDRGAAPAARDARLRRPARRARVDRATAAIMGWSAYVVAPVAVRSTVVAVLHADRRAATRSTRATPAILWTFAAGAGAGVRERQPAPHAAPRAPPDAAAARAGSTRARASWPTRRSRSSRGRRADVLPQPEELDGPRARADRDRDGSAGARRRPHAPRGRDPAAARRRAHEPRDRRGARDLRRNREVPRQQHPAQAARGEPRRGGRALLRAPGRSAPAAMARRGAACSVRRTAAPQTRTA